MLGEDMVFNLKEHSIMSVQDIHDFRYMKCVQKCSEGICRVVCRCKYMPEILIRSLLPNKMLGGLIVEKR